MPVIMYAWEISWYSRGQQETMQDELRLQDLINWWARFLYKIQKEEEHGVTQMKTGIDIYER